MSYASPTTACLRRRLRRATALAGHRDGLLRQHRPASGEHCIAGAKEGGLGFIATALTLNRDQRQRLATPFVPVCAVFVQNPLIAPSVPSEAFAKLFGLTPAELDVLSTLAAGRAPQEVADQLDIALSTVKSHLHKIFEKTGTLRQPDLVRLLMARAFRSRYQCGRLSPTAHIPICTQASSGTRKFPTQHSGRSCEPRCRRRRYRLRKQASRTRPSQQGPLLFQLAATPTRELPSAASMDGYRHASHNCEY